MQDYGIAKFKRGNDLVDTETERDFAKALMYRMLGGTLTNCGLAVNPYRLKFNWVQRIPQARLVHSINEILKQRETSQYYRDRVFDTFVLSSSPSGIGSRLGQGSSCHQLN